MNAERRPRRFSVTPNDIDVMLHYYISPARHPRKDAPAVRDAIAWFVHEGMLEPQEEELYNVTDRGQAWIKMLLRVPLPRKACVDEAGPK